MAQGNQGQNQNQNQGGRRNPGSNLTQEHREKGGRRSAAEQTRDNQGQFAGKAGSSRSSGPDSNTSGRGSSRTQDEATYRADEDEEAGHFDREARGSNEWDESISDDEMTRDRIMEEEG